MELKNFIDFAYSMENMEEVKNGKFKLPKEIIFELEDGLHQKIHREVKNELKNFNYDDIETGFDLDVFNMKFRFIK